MSLVSCRECQKEISSEAKSCPHCGAKPKSSLGLWLLVGGVIAILLISAASNSPPSEIQRERDAIERCWQEYERKSLDPETKRFVASTCELMERKFTEKHGHKP